MKKVLGVHSAPPGHWVGDGFPVRSLFSYNGPFNTQFTPFLLLDRIGADVTDAAKTDAAVLLLSGEPIDEPVVGYDPFVMNSRDEIVQAIEDFNTGKFGRMAT